MAGWPRRPVHQVIRLSAFVPQCLIGEKLVRHSALSSVSSSVALAQGEALAKEELRNPLIIKPDPAQSCLIKPTYPFSNPLLPLIHRSKLLVHPCPSVMKRVIHLKLGRADLPVRLLGFGSRAVRSDWCGRRTGRSALPLFYLCSSVSICVHLWLNIRENSRNSRPVSPSSEKLSPIITNYHHRSFMNSTPKGKVGRLPPNHPWTSFTAFQEKMSRRINLVVRYLITEVSLLWSGPA